MCVLCEKESDRVPIGRGLSVLYLNVTPSMAAKILGEHNKGNRTIKPKQVDRLASDITGGRWQSDMPDMCGLDTSMHIISAQHRLSAVIKAGKSAGIWFLFGLPQSSRGVTDQAVTYSTGDALRRHGVEQYANLMATTLKAVVAWKMGMVPNSGSKPSRVNLSKSWLEQEIDNHPKLLASVKWAMTNKSEFRSIPTSNLAFGHYITTRYASKKYGPEFWDGLLNAGHLEAGDPRRAMMRMFEKVNLDKVDSKVNGIYIFGIIKAWNLWIEDRQLKQMTYKQTETLRGGALKVERFVPIPELAICDE
jgi:hypothetical protein